MNLIQRLVLFLSLFFVCTTHAFSQDTHYVDGKEWIVSNDAELEKPLILFEFWATWCGPCIKAMPKMELLAKKFESNLSVIYVSEEPAILIKKFMDAKQKDFLSISDSEGKNLKKFEIESLPTSILMSPDGEIVWKGNPIDLKEPMLREFVNTFENEKGDVNRVRIDGEKEILTESNFSTFSKKKETVLYKESTVSDHLMLVSDNSFYFNGTISQLYADMYHIPFEYVEDSASNQNVYTIKVDDLAEVDRTELLNAFVEKTFNIVHSCLNYHTTAYVLTPNESSEGLSSLVYDYSESHAEYLAGDMDVQIDNATWQEMITVLNEFSETRFIGEGFTNDNIYDWNIHYAYLELTLDQLKNELNLNVTLDDVVLDHLLLKDIPTSKKKSNK